MADKLGARKSDLACFAELWERRSGGPVNHSPEIWDNRASEWISELSGNGSWAQNMRRRVEATAGYLRSRGLLGADDTVVDVGCGPGLFVMEFAKTARSAVGLDYSKRFIENAEKSAQSLALQNASFDKCDFLALDIEKAGLTGAFDLVFTSNSPAASGRGSLEKLIAMSRAYCFNTSIIHASDSLLEQISEDVFGTAYRPRWDGSGFYALANLLWLSGYYPETTFYSEVSEEPVTADLESAAEYAQLCGHSDAERVLRYLESLTDAKRRIEHRYGSILWDVRVRDDRYFLEA